MPTKKDLAALLSEDPQPPLRRGRGLRLSRASKQIADASLVVGARPIAAKPAEPAEPPEQPSEAAASVEAPAQLVEPPPEAAASVEAPAEPVAAAPEAKALAADLPAPAVVSDIVSHKPEREKRKLQLRKDLLKECKRIARSQDRKLYQVVESALEEYIRRHGVGE
jgi:hypothetical protein